MRCARVMAKQAVLRMSSNGAHQLFCGTPLPSYMVNAGVLLGCSRRYLLTTGSVFSSPPSSCARPANHTQQTVFQTRQTSTMLLLREARHLLPLLSAQLLHLEGVLHDRQQGALRRGYMTVFVCATAHSRQINEQTVLKAARCIAYPQKTA